MLVHWVWFSLLQGMNGREKLQLLEYFHSPEDIYALDARAIKGLPFECTALLDKDMQRANATLKACADQQIGILTYMDSGFPGLLRNVDDPPMVLYYRGRLPAWELQPVIGVVGTRRASPYGMRIATSISAEIAACGGIVASGGAFGIDSKALEGALSQGKATVAVMAGGLDNPYPKANMPLFHRIMENGCLLSEYPPGQVAYKGNFLRRNRIISGISNGVLVVEAPEQSGALNTARWASQQGKDVFAVPGNIDVESCAGSNALIGDLALAAVGGWSVMQHYAPLYPYAIKRTTPVENRVEAAAAAPVSPPKKTESHPKADKINIDKPGDCPYSVKENNLPALTQEEKAVVALLSKEPVPTDTVLEQLQLPSATALTIITRLSIKGVVKTHPGKRISLA